MPNRSFVIAIAPAALTLAAALSPATAAAANAGDWIVRGGITHVAPNDDTGSVSGN